MNSLSNGRKSLTTKPSASLLASIEKSKRISKKIGQRLGHKNTAYMGQQVELCSPKRTYMHL